MTRLPTFEDVASAAATLKGHAIRTPLLNNKILDDLTGAQVFLKAECLQRTGSFKFRGAFNALSSLPDVKNEQSVIACSSGNHAQGVAEAARLMGMKSTIIMPSDAPKTKKERTIRSGATVVEYDRQNEDREALLLKMAGESGAHPIHPYENFYVIAGQGTSGLEIAEDLAALNLSPDHVLVCAGGGGLLAGIHLAMEKHFPEAVLHPVEPEGYDDQGRSHAAGRRLGDNSKTPSVCDAIVTPMPGEASFEICKGKMGQGLAVTDYEALRAVAFAFRELKLVVEPGGAVTLAALLAGKLDVKGKVVVATLSGGNIDNDILYQALNL